MRRPMSDPRLEKLRYRAWRRGFREADLVLGGFADAHLSRDKAAPKMGHPDLWID